MPKSNSQQKSTPNVHIHHQQVGAERRGAGEEALLRVRTGPECPEGNWRELMWDSNLNCGIARRRINLWKALTKGTVCHLENKGRTEQFQKRASTLQTPPEAGGRMKGKGANSTPETASPTKMQTGFQYIIRLPEILEGWHLPGGLQPKISSPEETQGAQNRHAWKLRWGQGGQKSGCTWGVCACQFPHLLSCSNQERQKTQAQLSLCLCGVPKILNLSGLGHWSGHWSARNSGPGPYRATWNLSSVDGESNIPWSGANPVLLEHCKYSPHMPVTFVCSAPPSPQHDWIGETKQETTSTHLCQVRN